MAENEGEAVQADAFIHLFSSMYLFRDFKAWLFWANRRPWFIPPLAFVIWGAGMIVIWLMWAQARDQFVENMIYFNSVDIRLFRAVQWILNAKY